MSKKKKKIIIISVALTAVILLIVLALFGVFKKEEKLEPPKKKEKEKVVEKVKIVDVESKSRPFAVMINNIGEARRVQSGLNEAYIVYEIIVEGGITRFLALYKDAETTRIGSIRSARHYYLDYVLENDAIFVHWGYSDQAKSDIKTLNINNINGLTYEGKYFYRDNPYGISSEHTGFSNMEKLNKAVNDLKYRTETDEGLLLDYSAKSVNLSKKEDSAPATHITTRYSNSLTNYYEYDEESKLYNRFVNNKEHLDDPTKEQITAKNIIVYKLKNYTIAGDTKGRQMLDNIGSGEGYYISEGTAVKINWEKKSREAKTKYTYADGKELVVNDGNTFIQIMPLDGILEFE